MRGRGIGLRTKLNLLSLGLVLLTATGIAGFVVQREITTSYQDLVNTGLTTAAMIAQSSEYAVYTENQESLRRILTGLQASPDIAYAAVLGKQGQIILEHAVGPPLTLPTTLRSRLPTVGRVVVEELALPLQEGGSLYVDIMVPVVSRPAASANLLFLEPTTVSDPPVVLGYIQLGLSQARLQYDTRQFILVTGVVVALVFGFGLVLTLWVTRSITQPILALVEATGLVAEGRLDVDVTVQTADEVHQLAEAFNRMTARLRTSQLQLQEYQQGLEDKVAERTRQLEAAVQEARRLADAAQAASRAKSQFLANMSHEIRTPMNGVLGMTELLLASKQDGRQQHLTETIQRSGEALLSVINDILDFSKIEAGKLQLERVDFDIQDTVEDVIELFAVPAQQKGLELTYHLSGSFPHALCGDPVRLRQVLLNLIGNAIKFTAQGTIHVLVESVAETAEAVTLRCSVTDSGIGIPLEAQVRVFEAFSQGDGSTTRRFGGTGLGLAIVKEFVALMQGQLGVESRPGEGSTFWFTAVLQRQAGATSPLSDRAQSLATHKILAVDDKATNREILEHHLRRWGARAVMASSGREALACLQAAVADGQPFDLAILDSHMPDMDGLMLARMIRTDQRLIGLPLLMLTSMDSQLDVAGASTIDSWVRKPVRKDLLYQAIRGLRQGDPGTQLPPHMEPLTLAGPAHPKAAHILLVEDTPVNREVVIGMLELLGHQVNIAENGQSAVEALAQTTYDLVLMDCQMPIMDGFTATGVLRGRERIAGSRRRLPIIALTAHALKGDRERCFVAGMDDYLTKPFTLHQLQALLARWIPVAAGSSDPSSEPDCPTAPAQAVIDEAAWEGIRALQRPDRPNILHKTLTLYLAHSQLLIEQLQQVITTPDMSFVQAAAHTLKSSSAQLGAHHLAQLCKEVEAACQAGAIDQLSTRISSLVAEHRDVCVAMRYVLTSSQQE